MNETTYMTDQIKILHNPKFCMAFFLPTVFGLLWLIVLFALVLALCGLFRIR